MESIAVLGCGPAGMLAAHAAVTSGAKVVIYSVRKPSKIGGAQYLHIPVPGLTSDEPDGEVLFIKKGDRGTYARKVYGDERAETSWNAFEAGSHKIWSMQDAYERAWMNYVDLIEDLEIGHWEARDILSESDLVLSTVPRRALCARPEHEFRHQDVWIDMHPYFDILPESIIYSGTPYDKWYRASSIFDVRSAEYGQEREHCVQVRKPLTNTCNCWEDHPDMVMLGRYGRWEKAQLISDAYIGAQEAISALL